MPIWLSSPAKVKKLGVVERIVAGIFDAQGDAADAITNNDLLMGTRQLFSPWSYKLVIIDNKIQCLQEALPVPGANPTDLSPNTIVSNSNLSWPAVIGAYGAFRPGITQIRLDQPNGTTIIGTIVIDPNDDRLVIYTVDEDTTPQNTLSPITAVINPLLSGPDNGLPTPVLGTRYLLTESTGNYSNVANPYAWLGENGQPLVASANDIIEYVTPGRWRVVFVAADETDLQYVTNITKIGRAHV